MDTTKAERVSWRKHIWCHGGKDSPLRERYCEVGGGDLERLLNDVDSFASMEGVVEFLKSMREEDLSREDLMVMMAESSKELVACRHELVALEMECSKLKQQIYRTKLEAEDRKMS